MVADRSSRQLQVTFHSPKSSSLGAQYSTLYEWQNTLALDEHTTSSLPPQRIIGRQTIMRHLPRARYLGRPLIPEHPQFRHTTRYSCHWFVLNDGAFLTTPCSSINVFQKPQVMMRQMQGNHPADCPQGMLRRILASCIHTRPHPGIISLVSVHEPLPRTHLTLAMSGRGSGFELSESRRTSFDVLPEYIQGGISNEKM